MNCNRRFLAPCRDQGCKEAIYMAGLIAMSFDRIERDVVGQIYSALKPPPDAPKLGEVPKPDTRWEAVSKKMRQIRKWMVGRKLDPLLLARWDTYAAKVALAGNRRNKAAHGVIAYSPSTGQLVTAGEILGQTEPVESAELNEANTFILDVYAMGLDLVGEVIDSLGIKGVARITRLGGTATMSTRPPSTIGPRKQRVSRP
jgi:hypothetical protein